MKLIHFLFTLVVLFFVSPTLTLGQTGFLKVTSNPTGVSIYIDGKYIGTTNPDISNELSSGNHTVKAEKEGYGTQTKNVNIKPDEILKLSISLTNNMTVESLKEDDNIVMVSKVGQLIITSMPPELGVSINGKYQGKTPLKISQMQIGSFNVMIDNLQANFNLTENDILRIKYENGSIRQISESNIGNSSIPKSGDANSKYILVTPNLWETSYSNDNYQEAGNLYINNTDQNEPMVSVNGQMFEKSNLRITNIPIGEVEIKIGNTKIKATIFKNESLELVFKDSNFFLLHPDTRMANISTTSSAYIPKLNARLMKVNVVESPCNNTSEGISFSRLAASSIRCISYYIRIFHNYYTHSNLSFTVRTVVYKDEIKLFDFIEAKKFNKTDPLMGKIENGEFFDNIRINNLNKWQSGKYLLEIFIEGQSVYSYRFELY